MTQLIRANSCRSCKYMIRDGADSFCRRYPPQTFMFPQQGPGGQVAMAKVSTYNLVTPDFWCGEYIRNVIVADALPAEGQVNGQ